MRTFIFKPNDAIQINGFMQLSYVNNDDVLQNSLMVTNILNKPSIVENIQNNGGYYYAIINETIILGFLSTIGKEAHPALDMSYAFSWYNSSLGGVYLIGIDSIKNKYFAPIKKSL